MAFKKFTQFEGRSTRSEYWYFALVNFVVSIILSTLGTKIESGTIGAIPSMVYSLAVIIPSIALSVRRLHDTNRSGWWFFINFIPFIGLLIFLYFAVLPSDEGDNEYGPNPLLSVDTEVVSTEEPAVVTEVVPEQIPAQQQ